MQAANPLISVVIPVYRAETMLDELYRRLRAALETVTPHFEIVLVEDCGPDQSWSCLLYTSPSPRDRTRSRMPSSA